MLIADNATHADLATSMNAHARFTFRTAARTPRTRVRRIRARLRHAQRKRTQKLSGDK